MVHLVPCRLMLHWLRMPVRKSSDIMISEYWCTGFKYADTHHHHVYRNTYHHHEYRDTYHLHVDRETYHHHQVKYIFSI